MNASTDQRLCTDGSEFVWDSDELTQADRLLLPRLTKWIQLSRPQSILDLGCGNGALTAELSKYCQHCTGIDRSESGISLARSRNSNVDFWQAEFDQPLSREHRGRYDLVVSIEVVEHLYLPRQMFARAREALQEQGELIVSTPYHGYWKNLALAIMGHYDAHWHPLRDHGHIKFFSVATLCRLYREQGFEVSGVQLVGRIPALARSMLVRGKLVRRSEHHLDYPPAKTSEAK